jgi:glycosyltransferase involved in cell wall biosynthesis
MPPLTTLVRSDPDDSPCAIAELLWHTRQVPYPHAQSRLRLWYNPLVSQPRFLFHIVNSLRFGGAEQFVVNMLRYHDRTRYFPVCICLRAPMGTHLEAAVQQIGVPLYFLEISAKSLSWLHNTKLNALFKKYKPTVVHTHLGGINHAFLMAIRHRTPVRVHTVHSLAEQEIGSGHNRRVRLLAFKYRLGSFTPVAIAEKVVSSFAALYNYHNQVLIPNGIPTDVFTPDTVVRQRMRQKLQVEPQTFVFIHVGRIDANKNQGMLISAFSRLCASESVPMELWLVGDGDLLEAAQQQARTLGIENRVRFLGVRSDIPDLLRAADVFVFPSRWEGNPLSVMEAMATGLPVIATAVGGVPELVEDGVSGILIPNEDRDALVAAMQRMVEQPDLRVQMGQAARCRAVERFDIRQTVRAYEALYEEILQRKRRIW